MPKRERVAGRREESLSRERIVEAAIEILDESGEGGLTFRALLERLATGPGALYHHVAGKGELLTTACDAIVARTVENAANGQLARKRGLDRSEFLDAVATMWSGLDPDEYPFTRGIAERVRNHDDRADFLAGIDLILAGIEAEARRAAQA